MSRLRNVCRRSASVFVTSRAELISSFSTTSTPLAARRGLGGHAHALEQIGRALVAQRARIAHRADDHDRPRVADREVEEKGGLFERVGAAGDDDPGQLVVAANSSLTRRASRSHWSSVNWLLATLANCS